MAVRGAALPFYGPSEDIGALSLKSGIYCVNRGATEAKNRRGFTQPRPGLSRFNFAITVINTVFKNYLTDTVRRDMSRKRIFNRYDVSRYIRLDL